MVGRSIERGPRRVGAWFETEDVSLIVIYCIYCTNMFHSTLLCAMKIEYSHT